jgi:hypothetical protein
MEPPENRVEGPGDVLALGDDPFLTQRVQRVLTQAGFRVSTDPVAHPRPRLVLIQIPADGRAAKWIQAEVARVAVCPAGTAPPGPADPYDAFVEAEMSGEEIVRQVNEAFFRSQRSDRPPRYAVSLGVMVRGDGHVIQSTTVDISSGGLFVRSLNPPSPGTQVRLTLIDDANAGELLGTVVYTIGPDGDLIIQHGETERPVAAHPGMAIRLNQGQAEAVECWLAFARRK